FSELQAITQLLINTHGYTIECMEGTYVANVNADVAEGNVAKVQDAIEAIEELEDVIKVHCNL
ncbi:hypothetical protein H4S06_006257, partial [Coemansia sp. BCRC 34490]